MKYRKKPVVIEATQWHREAGLHIGVDGLGVEHTADGKCQIQTLEGPLRVSEGDWIITGIKGEKYPCKPDIFEATYEAVE